MASILIAVAHYYKAGGNALYASTSAKEAERVEALTACLTGLHRCFGRTAAELSLEKKSVSRGPERHDLTVAIVSTKEEHVIDHLPRREGLYKRVTAVVDDPMYLGFACQRYLAERLGQFDWYGFMEDDLVVHDPFMLAKLNHFSRTFGNDRVLQPNRFERQLDGNVKSFYVDGPLRIGALDHIRKLDLNERLTIDYLGQPVDFEQARNPHSGCYFLNAQQMAHWAKQDYFGKPTRAFIGPLESAATLGIFQAFRVFKTTARYLDYAEIEHYGTKFLSKIR